MRRVGIVGVSDLHLKSVDPLSVPTADGLNSRVNAKLRALELAISFAHDHDCGYIVDFGDLFDIPNPSTRLRNAYASVVAPALTSLGSLGIQFARLVGNHETDGRHAVGKDIDLFNLESFRVITQPTTLWFQNLLFVPEVPISEVTVALEKHRNCVVFGHFGVQGAVYPSGLESQVSHDLPTTIFTDRQFPTYLGHIHKQQNLVYDPTVDKYKVVFIGASSRADFGDRDITPSLTHFELDVDDNGMIVNIGHSFHSLPDSHFRQLDFHEGKTADTDCPVVDVGEGAIFKLRYTGSQAWFSQCIPEKLRSLLMHGGASKVIVQYEPKIDETIQVDDVVSAIEVRDFRSMVTARAQSDGHYAEVGLRFLEMALSQESGTKM